ncbi:MAG: hypothetical protein INR72_02920 [Williamsia herbipolensis]|uniref:Uncharacterized protein n=1 Tax=Williamsia serinedens TaxID=391736 RepID=A0ABT1H4H2_9NOCA|nr:hypothetical protein [Williamsia serinedens]MBE7160174.1 hypothetical protein [Williamsia herbipolensis]MCP2162141.1 hypothetical protein [Williamsia serinedens]
MTTSLSRPELQSDEVVRFEQQFTPRMFLSHIKTTVVVTDRRVMVHTPHVIFGFIEHGYIKREIPLRHVSQISSGTATSTSRIVYAVGCALFALMLFSGGFASGFGGIGVLFGLVLLVASVVLFLSAHVNGVFFRSTGGGVLAASGSKSELPQIERAGAEIGKLLFT